MFLQIHNRITVQITTWIFIALVSIVVSVLIVASNAVTIIMLGSVLAILAVFRTLPNYIANLSLIFFSLGTIFISLTTFRVGGEFFNASDLLYLISAVLLVVWLVILKVDFYAVFIKGNPFLAPLVIFVIGGLLSMFNSADTGFNAAALGKFIFLFAVWLPVAIYLHDSETKIKLLLIILAVATLLPVISCLSDYFLHTSITSYLNNMLKLNLELPDKIYLARFGSVMGHPNNFASLIVVVFPISLWLVLFTKSLFFKLCSVGFLVGIVLSIVITGSRACFVAIIVEVVVLYGLLLKKRWISFIVILMLAIIITINIQYISDIFPQSPIKRLSTMMSMDIGDYRADVNRVSSMKKAGEHPQFLTEIWASKFSAKPYMI